MAAIDETCVTSSGNVSARRPVARTSAAAPPGDARLPIQHAGNIAADASLRNGRLRITLNRLRVADYPGRGLHRVLFDFYAQNQLPGQTEELHCQSTFRAQEGQPIRLLTAAAT